MEPHFLPKSSQSNSRYEGEATSLADRHKSIVLASKNFRLKKAIYGNDSFKLPIVSKDCSVKQEISMLEKQKAVERSISPSSSTSDFIHRSRLHEARRRRRRQMSLERYPERFMREYRREYRREFQ
jgi:hypothetical protein